jgi:hypothetical protein
VPLLNDVIGSRVSISWFNLLGESGERKGTVIGLVTDHMNNERWVVELDNGEFAVKLPVQLNII